MKVVTLERTNKRVSLSSHTYNTIPQVCTSRGTKPNSCYAVCESLPYVIGSCEGFNNCAACENDYVPVCVNGVDYDNPCKVSLL